MTRTDETVARASEVLDRARLREIELATGKSVRRAARALKLSAIGLGAVLLAATLWGLVIGPLGVTGIMVVLLALLGVVGAAFAASRERFVPPERLAKAPLKALPASIASWLQGQRRLLPAPAQRLADDIGVKLQALGPQLQTLDEAEPAAAAIRRLVAEELPELVNGYGRVPPSLRRQAVNGAAPDAQLAEGLRVVDDELKRMSEQLARGDLDKLATQGKFLELKYQGDPIA